MNLLRKRHSSKHESANISPNQHEEEIAPDQAFADVFDAVTNDDPIAALESLDHLSTDDIIWRLTSENEILNRFSDKLPSNVKEEIQTAIVEDAVTLAVRRLPAEELVGIGLNPSNFDDAGISQPPTIRDALLLAHSWDSTDHDQLLGELTIRTLEALPDSFTHEPKAAFQMALEQDISFSEAMMHVGSQTDARLDADWGNAHQRVQKRRVAGEL